MSYTELYTIDPAGDCQPYQRYRNSLAFCVVVWDAMAKKYFNVDSYKDIGDNKKLWALANDARVEFCEKATHSATFDNVMVGKAHIAGLADCFREMVRLHPALYGNSHLIEMAMDMDTLVHVDTCLGICWQATSIIQNVWILCDEEGENCRPYNIHRDKKHWWMFEAHTGKKQWE